MNRFKTFSTIFSLSLLGIGCTPIVPRELAEARDAYQHAAGSRAADLSPAELHKAKDALVKAEKSWSEEPDSQRTRNLAYVAERKAQLAEAAGAMEVANRQKAAAEQSIQRSEHTLQKQTEGELNDTRNRLSAAEQQAADADTRAKAAQESLTRLAAVKEEERGMVITLNGSVLFPSDQATLLPDAQNRLNQVAEALLATKERNVVIEGHTDARGSESHNLDLSQRRAEAVRSYLVARGYEPDRVQARGIGKARPITDNTTAEGRANNRRVEIIVEPKGK